MTLEESMWDIVKEGVREYIKKYTLTAEEMIMFRSLQKNEYDIHKTEGIRLFNQLHSWSKVNSPEVCNKLEALIREVLGL